MFLKRKMICALDEYEDLPVPPGLTKRAIGIDGEEFIEWYREEKDSKYPYETLHKCIDDCTDDGWIGKKVETINTLDPFRSHGGETHYSKQEIEIIYVRSKGREMKHWYFFIPALLEKLSLKEIAFFGITTGIVILLGYLGVQNI